MDGRHGQAIGTVVNTAIDAWLACHVAAPLRATHVAPLRAKRVAAQSRLVGCGPKLRVDFAIDWAPTTDELAVTNVKCVKLSFIAGATVPLLALARQQERAA